MSQPSLRGHAKPPPGATIRVPAAEIERAVTKAIEEHGGQVDPEQESTADRTGLLADIARIEVRKSALALWLKARGDKPLEANEAPSLLIPWTKPPSKRFKEILLPQAIDRHRVQPIKFERRAALLKAIARGRAWLDEIVSNRTTVEQIAVREKRSVRHVNMTISMAFIAPRLVTAALEGRLPRGIGIAALRDAPAE